MSRIVIVHDVLGTLFGLDAPIEEVRDIFHAQLVDRSTHDDKLAHMYAELVVMDWYHAAQRDFTTLSINGKYQPIGNVFKATLPRILLQAGLVPPQDYENGAPHNAGAGLVNAKLSYTAESSSECGPFGAEVVDRVMGSLQRLRPRPGMQEAFTKIYREAPANVERVDVWGATNGSIPLATKLFEGALGDDVKLATGASATSQLGSSHAVGLFSCDDVRTAKPQPEVYAEIKKRILDGASEQDVSIWFVASHTWDTFAAKNAGFKTAWVTYEEFDMVKDIYGTPDVVGANLAEVAKGIMAAEA